MGAETVAVTCHADSQLAGVCRRKLVAEAAEKSVVMTKSFTSMLLLLECLAAAFLMAIEEEEPKEPQAAA